MNVLYLVIYRNSLQLSFIREAVISCICKNEVVYYCNSHKLGCILNLLRYLNILPAWFQITAWVVMCKNKSYRIGK